MLLVNSKPLSKPIAVKPKPQEPPEEAVAEIVPAEEPGEEEEEVTTHALPAAGIRPSNGGLTLPKHLSVPDSTVVSTRERWNTIDKVEEGIRMWNLPHLREPTVECPVLTAEMLQTADPKEYSRKFADMRIWYDYSSRLSAKIRANLLQERNRLEDLEAELRISFRNTNQGKTKREDRMTAEEIADRVTIDANVRAARQDVQLWEQHHIQVTAVTEGLERSLKLMSRQIELRREEIDTAAREQGMLTREGRNVRNAVAANANQEVQPNFGRGSVSYGGKDR
jgi:hypothetical protein